MWPRERGGRGERPKLNLQTGATSADECEVHYSLRLLVILVLLIILGRVAWEMWHAKSHRPIVASALLVAVGLLGFLEYRAQRAEVFFGQIATEIAHRDVSVRCEGLLGSVTNISNHLGYVDFDAGGNPSDTTYLTRDACNWLKEYRGSDRRVTLNRALGVHTLAHEAVHLQGVTNEAKTECYGLQQMPRVAEELGASPQEARDITTYAFRTLYPQLPSNYRTSECRPGGRLDLSKNDGVWP